MKYLLVLTLLLSGCAAFETPTQLVRLKCINGTTPWANDVHQSKEGVRWYFNKTGWSKATFIYPSQDGETYCLKQTSSYVNGVYLVKTSKYATEGVD